MNIRTNRLAFLGIFFIQLVSYLTHFYPALMPFAFAVLALAVLAATVYRLEWGVAIAAGELIVGGHGYLFAWPLGGVNLSLRLAIFIIVMSIWLARFIVSGRKNVGAWPWEESLYFLPLAGLGAWAVFNAWRLGHPFADIFFDANGWLYFAYIFPVLYLARRKDAWPPIVTAVYAGLAWLVVLVLWSAYFFAHAGPAWQIDYYRWLRDTRVGEITLMNGGFYRIFFVSGLYALLALWPILARQCRERARWTAWLAAVGASALVICSLSRSFWVGLAAGAGALLIAFLSERDRRVAIRFSLQFVSAFIAGLVLIVVVVIFPWPRPSSDQVPGSLFLERATALTGEAAVASRWALWTPLWQAIRGSWLTGEGFGSSVEYRSSDPRILSEDPAGTFRTYTFEWGWLDIWLKFGVFGVLAYLYLIVASVGLPLWRRWRAEKDTLALGLAVGVLTLAVVHFFTPYLNHPLGIGFVIAAFVYTRKGQT